MTLSLAPFPGPNTCLEGALGWFLEVEPNSQKVLGPFGIDLLFGIFSLEPTRAQRWKPRARDRQGTHVPFPRSEKQVPIMLLPKPLILYYQHEQNKKARASNFWVGSSFNMFETITNLFLHRKCASNSQQPCLIFWYFITKKYTVTLFCGASIAKKISLKGPFLSFACRWKSRAGTLNLLI